MDMSKELQEKIFKRLSLTHERTRLTMTFDEYQTAVMSTAGPAQNTNAALCLSALGICGEGGEFADAVKKHLFHGHPLDHGKLREELGDILWYVARACELLGTSIENVAEENIHKLSKRYPEGFTIERSINRED